MEVARATEAASRCVLVCFGVCWRVLACFVALCVSDAYSCVRALVCVGLVELEVRYALVISPPRQGRGSRVEGRGSRSMRRWKKAELGWYRSRDVFVCVVDMVWCCGVCVCMIGVGCVFVCQCRLVVRTRASHARDRGFDPLH